MSSIIICFRLEGMHCNAGIFYDADSMLNAKHFICLTNNKSETDVYCLRCCKKLKSKAGEQMNYSFHILKWQLGYSKLHLMKHVHQRHAADLMYDNFKLKE